MAGSSVNIPSQSAGRHHTTRPGTRKQDGGDRDATADEGADAVGARGAGRETDEREHAGADAVTEGHEDEVETGAEAVGGEVGGAEARHDGGQHHEADVVDRGRERGRNADPHDLAQRGEPEVPRAERGTDHPASPEDPTRGAEGSRAPDT